MIERVWRWVLQAVTWPSAVLRTNAGDLLSQEQAEALGGAGTGGLATPRTFFDAQEDVPKLLHEWPWM